MATEFTQDTVLHFLQSSGGSVRNSDLLAHFRNFIRDHAERDRNRELFKKFINSVATVQPIDGVSHVVLRKKFRGHVSGGGERSSSGPVPLGKSTRTSGESSRPSPNGGADKPRQKRPFTEGTTPAASGGTADKTILPAAGIVPKNNNNNNNVETDFNLKQKQKLISTSVPAKVVSRPALVVQQISEKADVKTSRLPEPPAAHQHPKGGQQRLPSPQTTVCLQPPVPEPLRARQTCSQPQRGLHQQPPLHTTSLHPQVAPRRARHRQSYKSAVSFDDDDEEEEEDVPMRRGSAGVWPLSVPLGDTGKAISASSPCLLDPPAPSVVSSSSPSSEKKPPKIYIQNVKGDMVPTVGPDCSLETRVGPGIEPGPRSGSEEWMSTRRSLPLEAERHLPSPEHAKEVRMDHRHVHPVGVQLEPKQRLSSSHSSLFSPSFDTGSPRGPGWNSSLEDLQPKTDYNRARTDSKPGSLWHHSSDQLNDDGFPLHLSTGDLCEGRDEAESSEDSTFSPPVRQRPKVARRLSSQLRSRMCLSLGADLDQVLQETRGGGGGSEAARLNRLHLISSSLSLGYDLSSSSLSSCSTPPRCHSLADLAEGVDRKEGRRSLPAASSSASSPKDPSKQSLVPLEPTEHAWLVKGAAGAWPDIYSLFREDSSLLNKQDFISGFTVLHWIAKHGDHRVLNTLWYGVQKAGLTFDINARSTCGHTPLHIAAIHGHKNIMRLLVSTFNADVKLRDTAGKKAWQYLSHSSPSDVFLLLGAPPGAPWKRVGGGGGKVDNTWKPEQQQQQHHRRRRRHHLSSASSGERPLTIAGTIKVKRSSSIAAFLKHKSLRRFHGQQSDSSI